MSSVHAGSQISGEEDREGPARGRPPVMNGDVIQATTPSLNARPDTLDFRDRVYEANLYEVQPASSVVFHVFLGP